MCYPSQLKANERLAAVEAGLAKVADAKAKKNQYQLYVAVRPRDQDLNSGCLLNKRHVLLKPF